MSSWLRRSGDQVLRGALLLAILVASGVVLGFAVGYPVSRIEFEESDAVRLDHARLAGEVDPAAALVTGADLPLTWVEGDPAVGSFGLLGLGFCGEEVDLPTALSPKEVAVFANPADARSSSRGGARRPVAVRRSYVDDVAIRSGCDQFFHTDGRGNRAVGIRRHGRPPSPTTSPRCLGGRVLGGLGAHVGRRRADRCIHQARPPEGSRRPAGLLPWGRPDRLRTRRRALGRDPVGGGVTDTSPTDDGADETGRSGRDRRTGRRDGVPERRSYS